MESKKDNNLYDRSLRASVVMGLLATLFTAVYAGPGAALRYALFLAWALVNLKIWRYSLRELLGPRRTFPLFFFTSLKVLWLAVLLALAFFAEVGGGIENFLAFLLGFNTPFLVLLLKALGSAVTGSQNLPDKRIQKRPSKPTDERRILEQ